MARLQSKDKKKKKDDEDERKRKTKNVKKGGAHHDDDSDADSHGNLKGFIAYSDEDESSYSPSESETESSEDSSPPPRRSAIAARKKIKKELKELENEQSKRKKSKNIIIDESSDEDSSSDEDTKKKTKKPSKKIIKKRATKKSLTSEEEESEDDFKDFQDSDDEDDEDEDEDYDDEDDDDDDDDEVGGGGNLILTLGGSDENTRMIPQRYNMKKEPESVKKFVKLVTAPMEDNTIDAQIDQFKALNEEKQNELLLALEKRPTITDSGVSLMLRILTLKLPSDIQAMILAKYNSLQSMDASTGEYFKLRNWLDKVVSVPFGNYKEMPIKIDDGPEKCGDFMSKARKTLDDAVYGQDDTKLQIMQYMSTKIANPSGCGMSLLLVGPPGIGKTSIIKNGIAKALDWPFQFISLGGDSDASTYTGHQLVYESSHSGKIVNSIINAKSMSTIMLFDEVDKVSTTAKGEEVQNLLIHLTDPAAHGEFEDKYLAGIPIDLSKTMFVFSANDINKIDKVLLDRLMVIELKGYTLEQKLVIAENYLLPSALKDVNLVEKIAISKDIMKYIIQEYAGKEEGVRELKRSIEQITQRLNMLRMYNDKELPFYIKDFSLPFVVKKEHIDLFLKKKEEKNAPPLGMYN
jgi:ATP-dependent Lon protease